MIVSFVFFHSFFVLQGYQVLISKIEEQKNLNFSKNVFSNKLLLVLKEFLQFDVFLLA